MSDLEQILARIEAGERIATEQLLPLVYEELKKLAADKLRGESAEQPLDATALVHEAYIRVVGSGAEQRWDSRGHFFAAAAEAMRRVLVDKARRRASRKRGGKHRRVELPELSEQAGQDPLDLLALDEALTRLEKEHPDKARIVKLRFFAGCSLDDTARMLGVSRSTVQRDWAFARAWLFGQMNPS